MQHLELGEVEGIEHVQKLPVFARLTYAETARLAKLVHHETRAAGEVIIERNALGEALYVVLEGEVRVTRGGPGQEEGEPLGRLGVGELFGEMSLVDDLLTSARVTASRETRLLVLPRAEFQALMAAEQALALKVYRAFCQTLSARLRRVNELLSGEQAFSVGVR
ncbi:MAG TPA: cyclic nucleotide-binding domain-containing protein [Myxococcota bacterium]|nr:cyclic nucleotide-binding domain-containing protein [Myxococcota bacterium]HRY92875.1 cyclic nucleotide-binding domain-containing protein [Myxococcota bacterium]HSA20757.1 cyclic nucleotide-binding domain-containing protein [Myxococcota bacterium]